MKRVDAALFYMLMGLLLGLVTGCVGASRGGDEARRIDSLCGEVYRQRYRDVAASRRVAQQAFDESTDYAWGRAEACNHLAFCHFMQMDYEGAEQLYGQVAGLTHSELERLVADVGLMQVYQRTAMNREYYLSRVAALERLRRIDDEPTAFTDPHSRARLAMARMDFWLTSVRYHQALEQDMQTQDCLYQLDALVQDADSGQWLAYHYLLGQMELTLDASPDEQRQRHEPRLRQLDELWATWQAAKAGGYTYFEYSALGALCRLMARPSICDLLMTYRPRQVAQLVRNDDDATVYHPQMGKQSVDNGRPLVAEQPPRGEQVLGTVDTLLPLKLLQQALQGARRADDRYITAEVLASMGMYYNAHGRYGEALDSLNSALNVYNEHHLRFYAHRSSANPDSYTTADLLQPTGPRDTICTELRWMARGERTVPEGIARIREQLSLAYAGLEQKEASDYNRNAYLDILDLTRQDREWESRSQTLEEESRRLGMVLCVLAACMVAWMVLFVGLGRTLRRREARNELRRRCILDLCQLITASVPTDVSTPEEAGEHLKATVDKPLGQLLDASDLNADAGDLNIDANNPNIDANHPDISTNHLNIDVNGRLTVTDPQQEREARSLDRILHPFITWAMDSGLIATQLIDEQQRVKKQRYVHQRHIDQGKRENTVKKTCLAIVSGIRPYMDRMAREIRALTTPKAPWPQPRRRQQHYQYAWELVSVINEYNDILARWVQLRQGQLSLNIETFAMDELLSLLSKGQKTFSMKGISLKVELTDAYVKADKALTLFMINTLADNARKYTPKGGSVSIYVRQPEGGVVEVSVQDTGLGLTPEQVTRLMGRESRLHEGSGFGLMNCKGIIEKYRKTDPLFRVCSLGVDSEPGRGSRFYFRLPAGVRRTLALFGLMVSVCFGLSGCSQGEISGQDDAPRQGEQVMAQDRQEVDQEGPLLDQDRPDYEALLDSASLYANAAYYCNLDGQYEFALQYIDSALLCLNAHYDRYAMLDDGTAAGPRMTLRGDGRAAELYWWDMPYNTDFHVILDVRNEAAVAFLALKQWAAYTYNNNAYTGLYKLLGEDTTLEDYCRQLERTRSNRRVGICLAFILLLFLLLEFYRLFIRRRLAMRWGLEQVMEVTACAMRASLPAGPALGKDGLLLDELSPQATLSRIVSEVYRVLSRMMSINQLAITLYDEGVNDWLCVASPAKEAGSPRGGDDDLDASLSGQPGSTSVPATLMALARRCQQRGLSLSEGSMQAFPLFAKVGASSSVPSSTSSSISRTTPCTTPCDTSSGVSSSTPSSTSSRAHDHGAHHASHCIGALCLACSQGGLRPADRALMEQIAGFMGQILWQTVLLRAGQCRAIEEARDEGGRLAHEDSLIHVQNMVLDNCLSTIKHETVYYPSRIRLLIDRLRIGSPTEAEERETLQSIDELLAYYQGMHDLLSRCARKQLEQSTFRRTAISVADLLDHARRYFARAVRGRGDLTLQTRMLPETAPQVMGDLTLLHFLLESLLDEAHSVPLPGELLLEAVDEDESVRFCLTDPRRSPTQQELDELFYPHLAHFTGSVGSPLPGNTVYLVGKQIIRDHDHYAGHRGCRMGAERCADRPGFTVYFTLFKRQLLHHI